jgi:hypothetical protein
LLVLATRLSRARPLIVRVRKRARGGRVREGRVNGQLAAVNAKTGAAA